MGKGSGMRPGQDDAAFKRNAPFGESPNVRRALERETSRVPNTFSSCCGARCGVNDEERERCPKCGENCSFYHD